mgnify:CR=1 FL=1
MRTMMGMAVWFLGTAMTGGNVVYKTCGEMVRREREMVTKETGEEEKTNRNEKKRHKSS